MKTIKFSPPDITSAEIEEVIDTLKSGWITTGPKTKKFEEQIADFCGTKKAVCLNSATACMELILRFLGVGSGDEVITSAYTYTASASVICHVGATPVLVDTAKDSVFMDYEKLEKAITKKTKVIIPVDLAGIMCDYDKILSILESKKNLFTSNNEIQKNFGRVIILSDSAHGFGSEFKGKKSGDVADFTSFSFHAVKNLTTAEGGALTWKSIDGILDEDIYRSFMLLSLHGQTKDALSKTTIGNWEYDIVTPGYKCNMTDIMASIGQVQLRRYPELLKRRKEIINMYNEGLSTEKVAVLPHFTDEHQSSGHLYFTRLLGKDENFRNAFIANMAKHGVATNVHYKPLPLLSAYKNLGFDIKDYQNAFNSYQNEVTLPLHTLLTDDDVSYIIDKFKICLQG